jgi:hypothetical protein
MRDKFALPLRGEQEEGLDKILRLLRGKKSSIGSSRLPAFHIKDSTQDTASHNESSGVATSGVAGSISKEGDSEDVQVWTYCDASEGGAYLPDLCLTGDMECVKSCIPGKHVLILEFFITSNICICLLPLRHCCICVLPFS